MKLYNPLTIHCKFIYIYQSGVTIPDEFTGEEVFATQLNEEEYPGLNRDRKDGIVHTAGKGRVRGMDIYLILS